MSRPLGVALLLAVALGGALNDGCYVAVSYDKVDGTAGGSCADGAAGASASLPACGGAGGTAGAGGAAGGAGTGGGG
ncbi:MAG: hypothetical protein IT373_36240 [Polyangiaceae bacterium]|nr:hypothetical protein [Polyangiaceae bacterium]